MDLMLKGLTAVVTGGGKDVGAGISISPDAEEYKHLMWDEELKAARESEGKQHVPEIRL